MTCSENPFNLNIADPISLYRDTTCAVCRYISVCYPFRREKFCTTRRASIVILGLSCAVLSLHVVQAYFWHFSDGVCDIRPELAKDVWSIWSWTTELLVFLAVPLAILVLNVVVIVARQRINEKMEKLLEGGRRSCILFFLRRVLYLSYIIIIIIIIFICRRNIA